MPADKETALWAWLLYDARLPVSQVKELLSLVLERELSLTELFNAPADQISLLGLDSYQNILEMTPNPPFEFQGIRWNAPLYPKRLR